MVPPPDSWLVVFVWDEAWGTWAFSRWKRSRLNSGQMCERGVRLVERSKGVSRSVIMAWPTMFWLLLSWDYLTQSDKIWENWRTFRFGNIVYVMQRRSNSYGRFIELSKYGGVVGEALLSSRRVTREGDGRSAVRKYCG